MTPEQERSASVSPSKPLDGEVVELEGERVRVRLETGGIGFLRGLDKATMESTFHLGQKGKFHIVRCEENDETLLSLVALRTTEASPAFEHDVDQIQSVFTQSRIPSITRHEVISTLDEQRIQQWLNRVEKNLTQLRKNRAKRLDEEFYSGS